MSVIHEYNETFIYNSMFLKVEYCTVMYKQHFWGLGAVMFWLKISVLLPKTQLELTQLPVQNICFCQHKHG